MKIETVKVIEVQNFNEVVIRTYGRPYNFQQQDGCKPRGFEYIEVPTEEPEDQFARNVVPADSQTSEMGAPWQEWLARNPAEPLDMDFYGNKDPELWWERNFYPDIAILLWDLNQKGLIPQGEYYIRIDW